ncbi:hypothetical protein L226DRAFT_13049 [Lentinus tigrinus ALCF2SS1-7]|uniref:uncharacterized protein n=1 Tax=Lentinus tigrinus ALCF2SS1-7 TaxID=1328758 RepID=UPI0011661559|nr:hypothetical protein L226DRAFT_13049 [Lentinus tigrinus ALCF2SS1-7]
MLRKASRPRSGGDAQARQCARPVSVGIRDSLDALWVSDLLNSELWPHILKRPCLPSSSTVQILLPSVLAFLHANSRMQSPRPLHVGPVSSRVQHRRGQRFFGLRAYLQLARQPDRSVLIQTSVYTELQKSWIPGIGLTDPPHVYRGCPAEPCAGGLDRRRGCGPNANDQQSVGRQTQTRCAAQRTHSSCWIAIWPHTSTRGGPFPLIDPETGGGA